MPSTAINRIDGLTTSVAVKAPCKVATVAAITLSGEQTVNSVACVAGDRVLVKDQADPVDNGIYVVSTSDWQRAADFDGTRDAVTGTIVIIVSSSGDGTLYRLTTDEDPIVFGTSEIEFGLSIFGAASTINFTQVLGGVARNLNTKVSEIVSVTDYGAVGDNLTDNSVALQLAITIASFSGGAIYFPPGIYRYGTTLTFLNHIRYYGVSEDYNGSFGSTLLYTGVGDAVQVNNPINSSTAANITVENLTFRATSLGAGRACFADVGSTLLVFNNCAFYSNVYGMILDQSELVKLSNCSFQLTAAGTRCLWVVNGADHTVGASSLYTNRITVENCQFYGVNAASFGIVDDGGIQHVYMNNNLDSVATPFRIHGVSGLTISGNEVENWGGTYGINFLATKISGVAFGPTQEAIVQGNFLFTSVAANYCLNVGAGSSIVNLVCIANEWDCQNATAGGVLFTGTPTYYQGMGNRQTGIGLSGAPDGNTVGRSGTYTPVVTATGGGFSLGNGTANGRWQRNGNVVTVDFEIGIGGTTNMGTGELIVTLPVVNPSARPIVGSVNGLIAAATFIDGSLKCTAGSSTVRAYSGGTNAVPVVSGWSATTPSTQWASGDQFVGSIAVPIGDAQLL